MGQLKVTVLGCGGSAGVPASGNYWGVCDPNEPKNRRNRCCLAVQSEHTTLIIDTGPDFRHQVNAANIDQISAVLYTHYHGDHVDGVADLRPFRFRYAQLVPIYATRETLDVFERTIPHLLHDQKPVYPKVLDAHEIKPDDLGLEMTIGDISFIPFLQDHTTCQTLGFRFGDFAYSVDVKALYEDSIDVLMGVKTWLVDAAGYHQNDNMVHMSLDQIYQAKSRIGAERAVLTSLTPAMDYQTVMLETPDGVEPAYDGMSFIIST